MSTFISYAQNGEDVVLYRALKSIERGCYVDVGANDPKLDSVTRAFYERGWRGINVEPVASWFEALQQDRPQDRNFQVAASNAAGTQRLYEVVGSGLSTGSDLYASRHREAGWELHERAVPARRLDALCDECGISEIHFLKIDVEGAERAVLEGIDLERLRPWIILVEATEPGCQRPTHQEWEGLILGRRYVHAYFDGLNRFYVSQERAAQLLPVLAAPPNVFDHYVRYAERETTLHTRLLTRVADQALAALNAAESRVAALRRDLAAATERAAQLDGKLVEQKLRLAGHSAELERSKAEAAALRHESEAQRRVHEEVSKRLREQEAANTAELERLHAAIHLRDDKIRFLRNTVSWRITAPVRWFGRIERNIGRVPAALSRLPVRCWDVVWLSMEKRLKARPERLRWVMRQLGRVPLLKARILAMDPARRRRAPPASAPQPSAPAAEVETGTLPLSIRRVYRQLLSAGSVER